MDGHRHREANERGAGEAIGRVIGGDRVRAVFPESAVVAVRVRRWAEIVERDERGECERGEERHIHAAVLFVGQFSDQLRELRLRFPPQDLLRLCRVAAAVAKVGGAQQLGARLDVIVRAFVELFRLWRNIDRELEQDPRASQRAGPHGLAAS